MTRYYDYIMAGAVVDSTAKIYKVALGDSAQGRRDYLFLTAYSVQHGHYFELHSQRSADFIYRLRKSPDLADVDITHVTGRDLVRHFKGAALPSLSCAQLASSAYMLRTLNVNYRIISNLNRRRATTC